MISWRPLWILAALIASFGLQACTITSAMAGEDLPEAALDSLKAGESTEVDVLRDLGPPSDVASITTGSIFVYRLTEEGSLALDVGYLGASAGGSAETRRFGALVVFFDHKGTVRGWGLSHASD